MNLITEQRSDKQKILIVDRNHSRILTPLKKELIRFDNEVFVSPVLPPSTQNFALCYVLEESLATVRKIVSSEIQVKVVFIFTNKHKTAEECESYIKKLPDPRRNLLKCISFESNFGITQQDIEKILWFSFAKTSEIMLPLYESKNDLNVSTIPVAPSEMNKPRFASRRRSWKHIVALTVFLIFLLHFAFIPPLLIANYYFYRSEQSLVKRDTIVSTKAFETGQNYFNIGKKVYSLARPTFQLLSIAVHTDNIIQFDDTVSLTLEKSLSLSKEAEVFMRLVLKKNKTNSEINRLQTSKDNLQNDLDILNQYIVILEEKIPNWKKLEKTKVLLSTTSEQLSAVQKLLPHLDTLLAKGTQKQYLLLFANNMELRPGGGFIGSFGVIKVHNYTIDAIKVYDVYDADGQLKTHIDPPDPIRLYLQQPHWFLRDSAWSPDFKKNYEQAQIFLNEELKISNFDGGILLTTTTIQNILEAMGDLYIPDFKEKVNKDNFYIKAQLYSEKNFFPGSTQKKRFLGAVADQILLNLERASEVKLTQMIKKSLEEKQLVMYFDDLSVQQTIESLYWSGQTVVPACPTTFPNCISNYLLPYEANLGVNKANFFAKKRISLKTSLNKDGIANNKLQITTINNSVTDIFPGGTYKNYLQVLLPATAKIARITKNDTLVDNYDIVQTDVKTIGVYLEVPAQSQTKLTVDYSIETGLDKGKGAYQLVVQKQIGSGNSEFQFELSYPENIYAVSQNFSPLVKDNGILYNTTLTADKIFFIELIKD